VRRLTRWLIGGLVAMALWVPGAGAQDSRQMYQGMRHDWREIHPVCGPALSHRAECRPHGPGARSPVTAALRRARVPRPVSSISVSPMHYLISL